MFKGHWVNIDPRSVSLGGSWQGKWSRPEPKAWDGIVIKRFYEYAKTIANPIVLDIGANTGSFCLLPKFHPRMKIYAFEPNPVAYEVLQSNIALNDLQDRVQTFPFALSDKAGIVPLYVPKKKNLSGGSRLDQDDHDPPQDGFDTVLAETRRLDDFDFKHVDLIKIDVEGHEYWVLLGGERTVRASMPALMVEWQRRNWKVPKEYHREEMREMLRAWGYMSFERIGRADAWITA